MYRFLAIVLDQIRYQKFIVLLLGMLSLFLCRYEDESKVVWEFNFLRLIAPFRS